MASRGPRARAEQIGGLLERARALDAELAGMSPGDRDRLDIASTTLEQIRELALRLMTEAP
ncbi:MAG: hypothetical protein HOW73_49980 [Polyangiaceae bacterium]|nr:hypothetical protein [Polyangiaceae bacterium]